MFVPAYARGEPAAHQASHARLPAAEQRRDLAVRQTLVVAQHQGGALPRAQRTQRRPQVRSVGDAVFLIIGLGPVGHRAGEHLCAAAQPADAQELVDHGSAQIGVPVIGRRSATPGRPVHPQRRVLHQILRGGAIMGELIADAQQPVA